MSHRHVIVQDHNAPQERGMKGESIVRCMQKLECEVRCSIMMTMQCWQYSAMPKYISLSEGYFVILDHTRDSEKRLKWSSISFPALSHATLYPGRQIQALQIFSLFCNITIQYLPSALWSRQHLSYIASNTLNSEFYPKILYDTLNIRYNTPQKYLCKMS
jgi:hypothetical protein